MEDYSPHFDQRLITLYQRTAYWLDEPALALYVNQPNPTFESWMALQGIEEWVYITAWNPSANLLDLATNQQRQLTLLARLTQMGMSWTTGRGIGPDPTWTPEESVLAWNASPAQARALAREFGQLAYLVGVAGGVPQLVWA